MLEWPVIKEGLGQLQRASRSLIGSVVAFVVLLVLVNDVTRQNKKNMASQVVNSTVFMYTLHRLLLYLIEHLIRVGFIFFCTCLKCLDMLK